MTGGTDAMAVSSDTSTPLPSGQNPAVTAKSKGYVVSPFEPSLSSSLSIEVGNLSIRYAALSRRGRDPDHPDKPNQDCYGAHHGDDFCPTTNNGDNDEGSSSAFFAVYDGHGPHGEKCSHFVREKLPPLIKTEIEQHQLCFGRTANVDEVHASLHEAHVECNEDMRASKINDSQSGTTSVGVYIHGNESKITVSNVGDSRIVLGTMADDNGSSKKSIQAIPLSKDHTPYRADEAARCRNAGARILSFGQIDPSTRDDDDVEDPPRVWSKSGNYPGTAFTRSLGDSVAETLGVSAEPEMLTLPISSNERLLVLASDGVYDVVSNAEVVEICFKYRGDPTKACEELIKKSHREWLLNDDCDEDEANYDDMTCLVVYFDHAEHDEDVSDQPTTQDAAAESPAREPRQGKRVRQKTLVNLKASFTEQVNNIAETGDPS